MSWCQHTFSLRAYVPGRSSCASSSPGAIPTPHLDRWAATADLMFKVAVHDDAVLNADRPRGVARDGTGFTWIATDAGVSRWDGTGFKTYTT